MSYTPVQATDHETRGPARLLEQFRRSGNLRAILQSYLRQIQNLEDAAWEVIAARNLQVGTGVVLDNLGRVVGRGRGDLDDTNFRRALRCQIRINRSFGKPKDFTDVAGLAAPDGTTFAMMVYPKAVEIEVTTEIEGTSQGPAWAFQVLLYALSLVKGAGDQLFLEVSFDFDPQTDGLTMRDYNPSQYNNYSEDLYKGLGPGTGYFVPVGGFGGKLTMVTQ